MEQGQGIPCGGVLSTQPDQFPQGIGCETGQSQISEVVVVGEDHEIGVVP